MLTQENLDNMDFTWEDLKIFFWKMKKVVGVVLEKNSNQCLKYERRNIFI